MLMAGLFTIRPARSPGESSPGEIRQAPPTLHGCPRFAAEPAIHRMRTVAVVHRSPDWTIESLSISTRTGAADEPCLHRRVSDPRHRRLLVGPFLPRRDRPEDR